MLNRKSRPVMYGTFGGMTRVHFTKDLCSHNPNLLKMWFTFTWKTRIKFCNKSNNIKHVRLLSVYIIKSKSVQKWFLQNFHDELTVKPMVECYYVNGLLQDCSNSIANALELLQSCTKPSLSSPSVGKESHEELHPWITQQPLAVQRH